MSDHAAPAPSAGSTADPDVATALGRYLELVDSVAPGLVEGLYVVGSEALGDWRPGRSDIDIVAVTAEPATDADAAQLRLAHALLAEQQPLPFVDGPYLAWGDLVVEPATGLHRPWTLMGELHHDGDCFEINPVTWYTLATYGVTARGPLPRTLGISLDVEARVRFVVDNLQSYWRQVGESITSTVEERRSDRNELATFTPDSFEWCVLGPLRLHFTAFSGDVVSKHGAAEHGLTNAPARFHDTIVHALAVRNGNDEPVGPDDMATAAELIAWAIADVTAAAH